MPIALSDAEKATLTLALRRGNYPNPTEYHHVLNLHRLAMRARYGCSCFDQLIRGQLHCVCFDTLYDSAFDPAEIAFGALDSSKLQAELSNVPIELPPYQAADAIAAFDRREEGLMKNLVSAAEKKRIRILGKYHEWEPEDRNLITLWAGTMRVTKEVVDQALRGECLLQNGSDRLFYRLPVPAVLVDEANLPEIIAPTVDEWSLSSHGPGRYHTCSSK